MNKLDALILETHERRVELHLHARRCAGEYDRSGYQIEALACAIREKALLDARAAVVGHIEPGFAFRSIL